MPQSEAERKSLANGLREVADKIEAGEFNHLFFMGVGPPSEEAGTNIMTGYTFDGAQLPERLVGGMELELVKIKLAMLGILGPEVPRRGRIMTPGGI